MNLVFTIFQTISYRAVSDSAIAVGSKTRRSSRRNNATDQIVDNDENTINTVHNEDNDAITQGIAETVQEVMTETANENNIDGRIPDTILKYSIEPDNSMMMIMYDAVDSGVSPIAMHDSAVKPKRLDMSRFSRPVESMPSDYVPTGDAKIKTTVVEVDVL